MNVGLWHDGGGRPYCCGGARAHTKHPRRNEVTVNLRRRLAGVTLVVFGALGIALSLLAMAGVWIGTSRLRQFNANVFSSTDEVVVRVDRWAAQAGDAVDETRTLTQDLTDAVREYVAERVQNGAATSAAADDVEQRLASALRNANDLLGLSTSATELIVQLLAVVDKRTDGPAPGDGSPRLIDQIHAARTSLANASECMADLEQLLVEFREKRNVADNTEEITRISLNILAKLDVVQEHLTVLRGQLKEARGQLAELRDRIVAWIVFGRTLFLFLIVWIGAGQYCLAARGCRMLRAQTKVT
jgi:hypothetical protein